MTILSVSAICGLCFSRQVTLENNMADGVDKVQIIGCQWWDFGPRKGFPLGREGAKPGFAWFRTPWLQGNRRGHCVCALSLSVSLSLYLYRQAECLTVPRLGSASTHTSWYSHTHTHMHPHTQTHTYTN